jgi:hypothetical protein
VLRPNRPPSPGDAPVDILMPSRQHLDVRTTLTLDDDIATRLQAEARRRGLPFKTLVNEHLRAALAQRAAPPFTIAAVDLGGPVAGRSYDDIAALLDDAEGAGHR